MNLNPKQQNVGELLSDRLFRIPDYQRPYSWEKRQRRDLFTDIRETHAKKRKHFMATVVARQSQSETRVIVGDEFSVVDIIDGQQRITTLIILFKAIAKALENTTSDNKKIAERIDRLLVKEDEYQAILLQTNHSASGIFASYIKTGDIAQDHVKTLADQNLVDAMRECEDFVHEDAANLGPADIYETVRNNFIMIYHQMEDEAVVYRVFETLNSRGLDVKWLDKTKSQLMALLFEHAKKEYEEAVKDMRDIWASVYETIGLKDSDGDEAMRFAGTLKEKKRPKRVLGEEDASRGLVNFASTEVKTIIDSARWLANVVKRHSEVASDPRLSAVTGISQARFLATAILLCEWPDKDKKSLMEKWEKVTFRIYGLAEKDARTKVGDYVGLGYDIINDKKIKPESALLRLELIGAEFNKELVDKLSKKRFWNECYPGWTTELRYILCRYDEHLAEDAGEELDETAWTKIWEMNASKSIEHISPQSKAKPWVHALGNLTMLAPGMNSSLKDKSPVCKAKKYGTVGIRGTALVGKTIEDRGQWGRKEVNERTKLIAKFVKEHWGD